MLNGTLIAHWTGSSTDLGGSQIIRPIVASSGDALIHFESDLTIHHEGFNLSYSSSPAATLAPSLAASANGAATFDDRGSIDTPCLPHNKIESRMGSIRVGYEGALRGYESNRCAFFLVMNQTGAIRQHVHVVL